MENHRDPNGMQLNYLGEDCNVRESAAVREEMLRQQNYAGETEPRTRPTSLKKHRKQNHPRFRGGGYGGCHETAERCDSLFATNYPRNENEQQAENIGEKSRRCRSRSNDNEDLQTYKEGNIYRDTKDYRTTRNTSNALPSSSSESEPEWEQPSKETETRACCKFKHLKKTGTAIARREMDPKSQTVIDPSVCTQEKSSDESFDDRHDSISRGIPHICVSKSAAYPAYHDASSKNVISKFSRNPESDDDRQTEHTTESKTYGMRRNAHSSPKVSFKSVCPVQQWASERTNPDTAVENKSEKEAEIWRIKREMRLMNLESDGQNACFQNESSNDSGENKPYGVRTDSVVTKFTNNTKTNDDRYTEQHKTYEEPKAYSRKKTHFSNSGVMFKPGDLEQQKISREVILDPYLTNFIEMKENQHSRMEVKPRNVTENCQDFYQSELPVDQDSSSTRNKIFHNNTKPYWPVETSRSEHSFEEAESNRTFFTKNEQSYNDFPETVCDANQNRNQASKWENRNQIKSCSSEAGWGVLESNSEVLFNPDSDRFHNRQRHCQVQEKEFSFDCGNQDPDSFGDTVTNCGQDEPFQMAPTRYFKHGEEFCSGQELCGRQTTDSYKENDDVIELNRSAKRISSFQGRGNSHEYDERQQEYRRNHYEEKQFSRCHIPQFSCGDHSRTGNGIQEHANFGRHSEKLEPCEDDHYRNKYFGKCGHQGYQLEDDCYAHFLPNSNLSRPGKGNYSGESGYYLREHQRNSGFTVGTSRTSSSANQQNMVRKCVSRSVAGAERVYKNSQASADEEKQTQFYWQMSIDYRSGQESNMGAVKDAILADLSAFGSKLSEAILPCHTSLQLFRVAYEEWLKARNTTLRMLRAFETEIHGNRDWQGTFTQFCDFLKTAGGVAEQILKLTPYGNVAVPVVRIVPPIIKKLGDMIMGLGKSNKKQDPKFLDMLQALQADIEESSQLKMFALQCEMQFKETEELFIELLYALNSQQMADAVEDMELLNFIIGLCEANPTSDSFFRHISDAYQKFYNSGNQERSATWQTFCSFIDRDPSILETLRYLDWRLTKSFQNHTEEKDLSMCWTTISTLVSNTNAMEVQVALNRIATIFRILEIQRNLVSANVSALFKAS